MYNTKKLFGLPEGLGQIKIIANSRSFGET